MRYVWAALALAGSSLALHADTTSTESRLEKVESAVRHISNKAGISFGGEFRSELFSSRIAGASTSPTDRLTETNEYTSVDFDIKARPISEIGARLIFRMHQNWQNFFSDISNPIFSRWISIDGNFKNVLRYSAGDFRLKYSPLTLYSPDIEMLYEPQLFSALRTRATDERFLGNNDRLFQGVTLSFDAEVSPIFNEFHFNALGIRLRSIETNIANGSAPVMVIESSPIEKYAWGGNVDATFLRGLTLGGTWLNILDNPNSFRGSDTIADTMVQNTRIIGVRPGVSVGKLVGTSVWDAGLGVEIAYSIDDTSWWHTGIDSSLHLRTDAITGSAIRVGGTFKLDNSRLKAHARATYIKTESTFRNELAQSPSFIGSRIMNTESDSAGPYSAGSYHYSTFDALYNNVFKFAPSAKTNQWDKAPFQKNSYVNAIFLQSELHKLSTMMDQSVQLVMPYGPATPNRNGIDISADFAAGGFDAKGVASILSEVKGSDGLVSVDSTTDSTVLFPKTEFLCLGGGASFDIASVVGGLKHPLVIAGSYVRSQARNAGSSSFSNTDWSVLVNFVNASVDFQFWKRASLLVGMQVIASTAKRGIVTHDQIQWHYGAGLKWNITKGAWVNGSVTAIDVHNTAHIDGVPDSDSPKADFRQIQPGILLSVEF